MNWGGTAVFSFFLLFLIFENVSAQNNTRQERQGSLFSVVSFPNLACRANNGLNGTCMTRSECATANGEVLGSCARGFGGCCFIRIQECGGDVRVNQTYIQNPDFPSATNAISSTEDRICTYRFYPPSSDTCNVRLDFAEFVMGPPDPKSTTEWKCEEGKTDYVTVGHADGNMRSGLVICGYNTGHHVYLDMGTPTSNPGYASIIIRLDSTNYQTFSRTWNILASFIDCNQPNTPPRGCQRYFFGNSGTGIVEAFNYNQPISSYAARVNGYHTVCIRREKGMCQISYVPPDYDTDDEGFAITGDPSSLFKGRQACRNPSPVACASYVRITQGSATGITPYGFPPTSRCDRHCGRRLCNTHQGCTSSDHDVVISRTIPFRLEVEFIKHGPTTFENRGYKLNYLQSQC